MEYGWVKRNDKMWILYGGGGVFLYSVISNDREKSLLLKLGTILEV